MNFGRHLKYKDCAYILNVYNQSLKYQFTLIIKENIRANTLKWKEGLEPKEEEPRKEEQAMVRGDWRWSKNIISVYGNS